MTRAKDEVDERIGSAVGAGGKYLVTHAIGRGGMGTVYRAVHRDLGEPVAIKFLHPMFANDRELQARFRREAKALARLRHASIVSLLDVSEGDEAPFMVMELVQGQSLHAAFEEHPGLLALPRIGSIFGPLLEVLELAHDEGIVHRDIKPGNVMLPDATRIKLLDFGLVQLPGNGLEKLTETGIVHGTPEYMSPEQCQGDPTDCPTDIYAVGIMLYQALAGRLPFDGKGAAAIMAAHLFLEPPAMAERSLGRSISVPLEHLVRDAIAKSATERPTAREMRQELTSILKGTDTGTLAEYANHERRRLAGLSRGERAFTGSRIETATSSLGVLRVLVSVRDEARATSIRSALGVSGIHVVRSAADELESTKCGAIEGIDVIVLTHDEPASDSRMAKLAAAHPAVPILVVDVDGTQATAEIIRQGASDMAAKGVSDADLARKVARLARRKR